MAGPEARRSSRLPLYNGTAVASLRLAAIVALTIASGGCAVSGMGGLFSRGNKDVAQAAYAGEDVTGSVAAPTLRGTSVAAPVSGLPSETDLVFARMAIVEVLKRGSKEVSAPWENASSGARGTVTPVASAYSRDGVTCHDFLASYIRKQGGESWLQGQACRPGGKHSAWEVKSLRPWTRS